MARPLVLSVVVTLVVIASAPAQSSRHNVVLITLDGARGEEMFGGLDVATLRASLSGQQRVEDQTVYRRFWAADAATRREKLMPFFWGTLMRHHGSIAGNAALGSQVRLTNRHWFSYPGYSEILVGRARDEVITSNDPIRNPSLTVLEYARRALTLPREGVAVFASWEVFNAIAESQEGAITINAGYEPYAHDDASVRALNVLQGAIALSAATFGYDMASDPVRRDALMRARDSGKAVVTGRLHLIADMQSQAAFLMARPIYTNGKPLHTIEERRQALVGFVVNRVRAADLFGPAVEGRTTGYDVDIFDTSDVSLGAVMFQHTDRASATVDARFETVARLDVAGGAWAVRLRGDTGSAGGMDRFAAHAVLVAGLFISGLLFIVVRALTGARERAVAIAAGMTSDLRIATIAAEADGAVDASSGLRGRRARRSEEREHARRERQSLHTHPLQNTHKFELKRCGILGRSEGRVNTASMDADLQSRRGTLRLSKRQRDEQRPVGREQQTRQRRDVRAGLPRDPRYSSISFTLPSWKSNTPPTTLSFFSRVSSRMTGEACRSRST